MRKFLLAVLLIATAPSFAQVDYYQPQQADSIAAEHIPTVAESRAARKRERLARKALKHRADPSHPYNKGSKKPKEHCYCPSQQGSSFWHDVLNDGIVGTGKAVYQSTIKPQVIGQAVGAVQRAGSELPGPALVGTTTSAFAISQVQKSRRHQRNRQVPQAGRACTCENCPYHKRYTPNAGLK